MKNKHSIPFFLVLGVLTVVGMIFPLRPTVSEKEKRNLTDFPAFSIESLASGDYFNGMNEWFSDTFPGRDIWIDISNRISDLHGDNSSSINLMSIQSAFGGDVIPFSSDSVPDNPDSMPFISDPIPTPKPQKAGMKIIYAQAISAVREKSEDLPSDSDSEKSKAAEELNRLIDSFSEEEKTMFAADMQHDGIAYAFLGFSQRESENHAMIMNKAGEALAKAGVRLFDVPAPTSLGIIAPSELREYIGCPDQGDILKYMFSLYEPESVQGVNAVELLKEHADEYVYFNTDHHWTALGAYYEYVEFCNVAGFEPVPIEEYTEKNMGEFLGSYYYSSKHRNTLIEDEVIAYFPPGEVKMTLWEAPNSWKEAPLILDNSSNNYKSDRYVCFLGGDLALCKMTNESIGDDSTCLVVKDSFGNPFSVFLTQHYHNVYVLDYRKNYFYKTISQLAEEYNADDVIVCQSIGCSQSEKADSLLNYTMRVP